MQKKLDLKYYLLIFIETFNIWQMGIIFYSSKTLTINNLVNTPIVLDNSILIVLLGYIIGIIMIYLKPNKTILFGRITMLISLVASCLLFLPITANQFSILYYILTFNCVFFISINNSLIINYYTLKTVLTDAILAALTTSIIICICQNQISPLSFNTFNIISIICLILITFSLFKLPNNYQVEILKNNNKVQLPSKKLIIGLILIQLLVSLNTLFNASISQSIGNGISVSYLGLFISSIIFIYLYKKKNVLPFKIAKYYFVITSLGFLLYLFPSNKIVYISLFFQGFTYFLILITPYFFANLFEIYPSKLIAPFLTFISLVAVCISALILEVLRNNTILLYSTYCCVSIFAITVYLLFEKDLQYNQLYKTTKFQKLSIREKEVAELILKGYSAKEISNILFLSIYTVKDHTKNIYKKYKVNSKIKLIEKTNNE